VRGVTGPSAEKRAGRARTWERAGAAAVGEALLTQISKPLVNEINGPDDAAKRAAAEAWVNEHHDGIKRDRLNLERDRWWSASRSWISIRPLDRGTDRRCHKHFSQTLIGRRVKLLLPVACIMAVTSCAPTAQSVWVKPGSTQREFSMDAGQCKAQGFGSGMNVLEVSLVYSNCMQGKGWDFEEQPAARPIATTAPAPVWTPQMRLDQNQEACTNGFQSACDEIPDNIGRSTWARGDA
jgi:hypothetical protein